MLPEQSGDDWAALATSGSGHFTAAPSLGAGFEHTFLVPFSRSDVWAALLAEPPLGAPPHLAFTTLRPGAHGAELSPGCVRRAAFLPPLGGETVSELVQLERGSGSSGLSDAREAWVITWRQLQSATRFDLRGRDGHLPEISVRLKGGADGTMVSLVYNFASVEVGGRIGPCLSPIAPLLLRSSLAGCAAAWADGMRERGYAPTTHPIFGDSLLSDRGEEAAIRARAANRVHA